MTPSPATHDPLTSVLLRAELSPRLQRLVERVSAHQEPLALIVLDLDHFKSINDAFGHLRGDQALVEVASRLKQLLRASDEVFRYGGDEFVLLLPYTSLDQAHVLAQRLIEQIGSSPLPGAPPISISLSMGIAALPADTDDAGRLFEIADRRLAIAKHRGRGQAVSGDRAEAAPTLVFASRLIERDAALSTAQRFLDLLPQRRRGILAVTGMPGTGRSAVLGAIGHAARLRGLTTLTVRARPALRLRAYAALSEAWDGWGAWHLAIEAAALVAALVGWLEAAGASGLLLLVDDWPDLDAATHGWLAALFTTALPYPVGLAYAEPHGRLSPEPPAAPLHERIELGPLSPPGLRIWLRTLLQWEAPHDFVAWLHRAIGGSPALVQPALALLIEHGMLRATPGGWSIGGDLSADVLRATLLDRAPARRTPLPTSEFVGRSAEIELARQLLGRHRLVTIVGPGGVGKTRLALQLAAELHEAFRDGTAFVALADLDASAELSGALAAALGLELRSQADASRQLVTFLASRHMLLVLDNCEHQPALAELAAEIIAGAPDVLLLATSRAPLQLVDEALLPLAGMAVPDEGGGAGGDALQLFCQCAMVADPRFTLTRENLEAVRRICRQVDGLPLGIALAAAWVGVLTCHEIAAEIAETPDNLADIRLGAPARHRSLRAVFAYSWALLAPDEQRVLRGLSVFLGSFRRETAREIVGASLAQIAALVNKSLLRREPDGRYALHEVIRRYAVEELARVPAEHAAVVARFIRYYEDLACRRAPDLIRAQQQEALADLDGELANLRAAMENLQAMGDVVGTGRFINALWRYWFLRGDFAEFGRWLLAAPEGAHAAPEIWGRALSHAGFLAHFTGQYGRAAEVCAQAEVLARATGDRWALGLALAVQGANAGERDVAAALLDESVALARDGGDDWLTTFALSCSGAAALYRGQRALARELLDESVATARALGDRWLTATALFHLGRLDAAIGDHQAARARHAEGLVIRRELNDRLGCAYALLGLGESTAAEGDYAAARGYHAERLELERALGNQPGVAAALASLGRLAMRVGDLEQATALLREALDLVRQLDEPRATASALHDLGELALLRGELSQAVEHFGTSLLAWRELGSAEGQAQALLGLGDATLALEVGGPPTALQHYQAALQLAAAIDDEGTMLEIVVRLGELQTRLGHVGHGCELLMLAAHHDCSAHHTRERARALLASLPCGVMPGAPRADLRRTAARLIDEPLG